MPRHLIQNVAVRGIAAAVPRRTEGEAELAAVFGERNARRLVMGTGVRERRIDRSITTSDLCEQAAGALLDQAGWSRDSVNHLIFVTQSPDYIVPQSACILQDKLGLPTSCSAFDVRQGCAGLPFGIWMAGKLLERGERALLLTGDVCDRTAPEDRSAIPIFGDGGAATLIEYAEGASPVGCSLGTDGSGYTNIIIPGGASRNPPSPETRKMVPDAHGILRSMEHLHMNGPEVFSFALQSVPPLIAQCLDLAGWSTENCGDVVFHQANEFMLKTIADKIGVPMDRVPLGIERFGNTSSASIPLALVTERREALRSGSRRYVLAGFGVGWSWAGVALEMGPLVVPDLIEVE